MLGLVIPMALTVTSPAAGSRSVEPRPPICACDPIVLPGDEALILGRRLAVARDLSWIETRADEMLTKMAKEHATQTNSGTQRTLQARSPVFDSPENATKFRLMRRISEHVGLAYASLFPLEHLREIVAFSESKAGSEFLAEARSAGPSGTVAAVLRDPELHEDLLNVVCGIPFKTDVYGPHHQATRLHLPISDLPPGMPVPGWCRAVAPSGQPSR